LLAKLNLAPANKLIPIIEIIVKKNIFLFIHFLLRLKFKPKSKLNLFKIKKITSEQLFLTPHVYAVQENQDVLGPVSYFLNSIAFYSQKRYLTIPAL